VARLLRRDAGHSRELAELDFLAALGERQHRGIAGPVDLDFCQLSYDQLRTA
jgi:hypothetical protein